MSYSSRVITAVALTCLLASAAAPSAASAALRGEVLLAYGETYRAADGGAAVHRGVDVALPDGAQVGAPIAGEVTFAGRIPSSDGGSVLCVTLDASGDAVTISPLERIGVAKGDRVDAGQTLGTLAGAGDPSAAGPHVHISLRRRGVYLDPSGLVGSEPLPVEPSVPVAEVPVPAADPVPSGGPTAPVPGSVSPANTPAVVIGDLGSAVAPVGAMPFASPSSVNAQPGGTTVATPEGIGVVEPQPDGAASSGDLVTAVPGAPVAQAAVAATGRVRPWWRPSVPAQPSLAQPLAGGTARPAAEQAAGPRPRPDRGSFAPVPQARIGGRQTLPTVPRPVITAARRVLTPGGLAAVTAVVLATLYLVSRRVLARRLVADMPVSDRFGSMLQHLRAGDTLCGLTSCSGLLPSQSRGRLAQRR